MPATARSVFSVKVHLVPIAVGLEVETLQTLHGSLVETRSKAQLGPVLFRDVAGVSTYRTLDCAADFVLVCL